MAQESERPAAAGVTEMHVRMDCNGCVNRIKKALHGVEGIYEVQVDFPQQKLTVIGRATPEKIVKAIKKTRKIATICSHTEAAAAAPQPPSESAPATADPPAPAADAADHQPAAAEAPPVEAPAAPPAEQTQEPPTPEDAGAGDQVKPPAAATSLQPEDLPAEAKDVGEIHMIHHQYYPHHHHHHHRALYQDHWVDYRHPYGYGSQHEAPFSPVIHSYHSRYTPATHISEYGYLQPTPQSIRYSISSSSSSTIMASEPYSDVDDFYRSSRSTEGSNTITSMFSDENPNACTIV